MADMSRPDRAPSRRNEKNASASQTVQPRTCETLAAASPADVSCASRIDRRSTWGRARERSTAASPSELHDASSPATSSPTSKQHTSMCGPIAATRSAPAPTRARSASSPAATTPSAVPRHPAWIARAAPLFRSPTQPDAVNRTIGGGEDPPLEAHQPQGPRVALSPRGARDEPPHAPEHREGVPLRRARGRRLLHRDGVPRGEEPRARSCARGAAEDPACAPWRSVLIQVCGALEEAHRRASSTATSSPRTSSCASNGGIEDFAKVLDFGLAKVTEREMQPGLAHPHAGGHGLRDAGVHVARAGAGQDARRAQRRVLPGGDPLRAAHGQAALRARRRPWSTSTELHVADVGKGRPRASVRKACQFLASNLGARHKVPWPTARPEQGEERS
jgi:hypothetical protein